MVNTGAKRIKILATNSDARRQYFLEDPIEAGIVLKGTEIKSLRNRAPSLRDSYVDVQQKGLAYEAYLVNVHIEEYSHGNRNNHDPVRRRKLLLHKDEIIQLFEAIQRKGMTAVATSIYLKSGRAKVEVQLGKGKKNIDRREDQKEKSAHREMDRALKRKSKSAS